MTFEGSFPNNFSRDNNNSFVGSNFGNPAQSGFLVQQNNTSKLDFLAAIASEKGNDTLPDNFKAFWDIACEMNESEAGFIEDLGNYIGIEFLEYSEDEIILSNAISPEEMHFLANVMKWACLLSLGYLPNQQNFTNIKEFLGIDHCIELLLPSNGPIKDLFTWIDDLANPDLEEGFSKDIRECIYDVIADIVATDRILSVIGSYCELCDEKFLEQFKDIFDKMNFNDRIRWGLFVSVAGLYLRKINEGITAKPGIWPDNIPKELIPLIERMDKSFCDARIEKPVVKKKRGKSALKLPTFSAPLVVNSCKFQFPDLPNWMPNGGNSCYLSSSLWGLFFVANEEVQERIRFFQEPGNENAHAQNLNPIALKDARQEFIKLYNEVSAKGLKYITIKEVNNHRKSMQVAIPKAFLIPGKDKQEDAFDYLSAIMTSLLALDSCSEKKAPKKFHKYHVFTRVDDNPLINPENYNYEEALSPVFGIPPLVPLIDIKIDEGNEEIQTFKNLITDARMTETIDRHAYKRSPEVAGPKYYPVSTTNTEQIMVESRESAPEYFIGRLARFNQDPVTGVQTKRQDVVLPNASLDFSIIGKAGETVPYDLVAITVHSGTSIGNGHYYTYIRKQTEDGWKFFKYDDIAGPEVCKNEKQVIEDAAQNGYNLFYKKRVDGQAPPLLSYEIDFGKSLVEEKPLSISPSSNSNPINSKKRKRKEEKSESSTIDFYGDSDDEFVEVTKKAKKEEDLSKADVWIAKNLSSNFSAEKQEFSTIEDLFSHKFDLKFGMIQKKGVRREAEILAAACENLNRPIFIIDPKRDRELQIIIDEGETLIFPGQENWHGEFLEGETLYIFRQADGTYVCINRKLS